MAASRVPMPLATMRKPSWDTVPYAITSLMSVWRRARQPPSRRVHRPTPSTSTCHDPSSAKPGASRATRNTPAFTMAAACRYADTGVGAAMAAGSQKWNGTCADLDRAPTSTSATAASSSPRGIPSSTRPGAAVRMPEIRHEPACTASMIRPTSMARPPKVVTISAWIAERRAKMRCPE